MHLTADSRHKLGLPEACMMAIGGKFAETRAISLNELLSSKQTLKVPRFQRNYAWSQEKAEALWNDIMARFEDVWYRSDHPVLDAQYLLGPIVLVNGKEQRRLFVIDGQQRLATITVLLCAARDIMFEYKEIEGVHRIDELLRYGFMGNYEWKLELNDTDKELFLELLTYEPDEITQIDRLKKRTFKTKSEKLLAGNYKVLYSAIMEFLNSTFNTETQKITGRKDGDNDNDAQYERVKKNVPMLNHFIEFIGEYNYVVMVMVSDDNTAFQIFETLNERGQTLSKSNLIKNHLLNCVNKDNTDLQRQLSDKWNAIFDDVIGQGQKDDDFIMESLRSRYFDTPHKISGKNLYKIIQEKFEDESSCKMYIEDLEKDAKFLSALNDPSSYPDDETRDEIRAMRLWDAKFIRTPILTAYRKWGTTQEYKTLVDILVKFFFKFRIVQQKHPGKVEDVMINQITRRIHDGQPLADIISVILANDNHEDFLYNFEHEFVPEPGKAGKYALQQITISMGTNNVDVKPIDDLTLEYILPKSHSKHWPDFLGSKPGKTKDFVPRLGNLTLLHHAIDIELKNNAFLEKRDAADAQGNPVGYKASNLKINTETVCNHNEWTPSIIEEREKMFREHADRIWNLESYGKNVGGS